jgi:lipid-A-disaccharide synthase
MKILISAAEASSDLHGAELLKALRRTTDPTSVIDAFGIGGPKLQAAGLRTVVDARSLLAMGFTEILGRLPAIFRALRKVTEEAARLKPDVAIVLDYPDFHFRLARRLKKIGIPVIYYIPPKLWVWRQGRVRNLRRYFVRVLSILPFEETFYRELNVPVRYVGNPLVDVLPFSMSRQEARNQLSLEPGALVLVLMPGSRKSELKSHLSLMIAAAVSAARQLRQKGHLLSGQRLVVLMPFPLTTNLSSVDFNFDFEFKQELDLKVSQGDAYTCLIAADAGMIKSGTSTLEAGLLQCPHSVVYKTSVTTAWIFKHLIRYRGPISLVNLVMDWHPHSYYSRNRNQEAELVREIVCEKVTVDSVSREIFELLSSPERREKLIRGFQVLKQKICGQRGDGSFSEAATVSPSQVAAQEIIQFLSEAQG